MRNLLPITTFVRVDVKRLFRDKVSIFFVFFFPLMFLLVFGFIFGRDSEVSFDIALFNESKSEFATSFEQQAKKDEVFQLKDGEIKTRDDALEQLKRGSIDAIVVLPKDFGVIQPDKGYPTGTAEVIYDKGNEQAGFTIESIFESIFARINADIVKTDTPFKVSAQPTDTEGLTSLDFIFSGILGFTMLASGIFGPTYVFPRLKEKGILRRYHTTPIRVWQYFIGNVMSNSLAALLSVALMFVVALTVFDINMRGDYLSLVLLVLLGSSVLFGVGLAVGGWAKNEAQASPLSNIIAFPMMFLSGVFFPRFLMPEWLQTISSIFPLTPLIDGLRLIITEGRTIFDLGPEVGLLVAWGIVIYLAAFKLFRWE